MFNPLSQYLMIGKLVALLGAIALICWQSSQIHRWHHQFESERTAHIADRATYQQAQKDAATANHAQVQKVEQQYQRNSDDERQAYLRDLAQLRAGRVRPQAPAAPSAPGGSGPPQAQPATSGADADGLHLSTDEYLQAQEIELRLMHLQNYVAGLLAINPNAH